MKRTLVIMLVLIRCLTLTAYGDMADTCIGYAKSCVMYTKHREQINDKQSLLSGTVLANAGSDSSDWLVIAASRLGLDEDYAAYGGQWERSLEDQLGGRPNATELHRAVLTALSLGKDPTDISGHDLVGEGTWDRDESSSPGVQGVNGWIWALIALDSYDWRTPEGVIFDRGHIIEKILENELAGGGFSLSDKADTDLTAMALQALAPYRADSRVSRVIDTALAALEKNFAKGDITCEGAAQTVCALCCLGLDDSAQGRFSRGSTPFEVMMSFYREDGGFAHLAQEDKSSPMATAQAMLALAATARQEKGMRTLYDFKAEPVEETSESDLGEIITLKNVNTSGKGRIYDVEKGEEYFVKSKKEKTSPKPDKRVLQGAVTAAGAVAAVVFILRKRRA